MKRNRKEKARKLHMIRLWTYPQARKALPYLRSVTQSLRDVWLEAQNKRLEVDRLARRPGRPNRTAILQNERAIAERSDAEDRFNDALSELMSIDVYLLDPVGGVVFVPFKKGEELAWFVFDLFDNEQIKTWRLHQDPLEMRRPIDDQILKDDDDQSGGVPSEPGSFRYYELLYDFVRPQAFRGLRPFFVAGAEYSHKGRRLKPAATDCSKRNSVYMP